MRLDVTDAAAFGRGHRLQGANLVDDHRFQLGSRDIHAPPAEALQIGERRVGANADPALFGRRDCPPHDQRIPGMKAAGNIGAGDDVEQGLVIPHGPRTEAFTEVGIEIDVFVHEQVPQVKDTSRAVRALRVLADRQ